MKKVIYMVVLAFFGIVTMSCEPNQLEEVNEINLKTNEPIFDDTVGENGEEGVEEDSSGDRLDDTVGENGEEGVEEDGSGNRLNDTVGENGEEGVEEDEN